MNASLVIGLVAGLVVGVSIGARPRKVMAFAVPLGFLLLIGAFYAAVIGVIVWLTLFLAHSLRLAPWYLGAVVLMIVGLGMFLDHWTRAGKRNEPT